MPIRARLVSAALAALCLFVPSRADAWFGEGWLEKLSGPGPFTGNVFDARLVCFANPNEVVTEAMRQAPGAGVTYPPLNEPSVWRLAPTGCHYLNRDTPRLEVGIQYTRMTAKAEDNPLDYTNRFDVGDLDKAVNLRSWIVTADVRVNRVVDVGFGAGWNRFSSPSEIFRTFSKGVVQPLRVTVRPFSPLTESKRTGDLVSIRVDVSKFLGELTAEEFGGRPGTFNERGEWVWGAALVFDFSTLFW